MNTNAIRNLYRIKERYFRPVIAHPNGLLCHAADCAVHRPIEIYRYAPCTCGLNYDLHWLGHGLAEKLNPNFGNEYRLQEVGVSYTGKVPQEEVDKLFEAFLEKTKPTETITAKAINETLAGISSPLRIPEEIDDDEIDWLHIAVVFSEEYCELLKSNIHNQKCPTCDWSWYGEADQKCSFCKSLQTYRGLEVATNYIFRNVPTVVDKNVPTVADKQET